MALSSRVLRRISENLEDLSFIAEIEEDTRLFNDPQHFETHHWSPTTNSFSDYGLHSKSVRLISQRVKDRVIFVRKVLKDPVNSFVNDVYGYVNLFPFLLKILPEDSDKLGVILKSLNKSEVCFIN